MSPFLRFEMYRISLKINLIIICLKSFFYEMREREREGKEERNRERDKEKEVEKKERERDKKER